MSLPKWLDMAEVHRWLTLRCEECGHRFRWKRDARFANSGGREVFHSSCMSYRIWRKDAEDRLEVLRLALDLGGLSGHDLQVAAELRADTEGERIATSGRVWRVTRALTKMQEASA